MLPISIDFKKTLFFLCQNRGTGKLNIYIVIYLFVFCVEHLNISLSLHRPISRRRPATWWKKTSQSDHPQIAGNDRDSYLSNVLRRKSNIPTQLQIKCFAREHFKREHWFFATEKWTNPHLSHFLFLSLPVLGHKILDLSLKLLNKCGWTFWMQRWYYSEGFRPSN